jgi:hypothetical protein
MEKSSFSPYEKHKKYLRRFLPCVDFVVKSVESFFALANFVPLGLLRTSFRGELDVFGTIK